jgi:hypothetical protein
MTTAKLKFSLSVLVSFSLMPAILFSAEFGTAKTSASHKPIAYGKTPARPSKTSDAGFIFQDEVTKEMVIDVHRDHSNSVNPFEDLSGKFKPESPEYRALLLAAGVSADTILAGDENIEVKSLKTLRLKFDQEFDKLSAEAHAEDKATEVSEEASQLAEALTVPAPAIAATATVATAAPVTGDASTDESKASETMAVSANFAEVSEAGFTDPKLGDYRLIPLERGLMMAGKSGEKRVFSNREVLKDDVFSVAIGESGKGDRVLAILHQPRKRELESDAKFTVWVLALTGSRIGWTKTLEFNSGSSDPNRSMASEQAGLASQLTLSGDTVSIAIGGSTKTLALENGETAGPSSLTPASEN